MAVLEINKNPSGRDYLVFVGVVLLVFGVVGAVLRSHHHETIAYVVWGLGAVILTAFVLVPRARRSLYLGWIYAFFPLGFVMSHLVLGVIYFLILTPVGLVMRVLGRDPLNRRMTPEATSYFTKRPPAVDSERYFRQH